MDNKLQDIEKQLTGKRNFDKPPLHLWQPPLSGDIDILIDDEGQWYHQGDPITRQSIATLFSRILRREDDGDYYLVTPAEKWRIRVALHPLMVVDADVLGQGDDTLLRLTLNNGSTVEVGAEHPLSPEPRREGVAVVALDHGLTAMFSRACWYRLIDQLDDDMVVRSQGYRYPLITQP
ncbi:MAG: DUF1285 domain-containing protein [Halieaceae bacterium]